MIIEFNSEGRFAHQLSQLIHLLIIAKEQNTSIHYRSFQSQYAKYFQIEPIAGMVDPTAKINFYFSLYQIFKLFKIKKVDTKQASFRLNHKRKDSELLIDEKINAFIDFDKAYFIFDYALKDIKSILHHRNYIKKTIQINADFVGNVDQYLNDIRSKHEVILGLHIRRTDYAHFQGGRFYLEDSQLSHLVESFHQQIGVDQQKVAVIICSDEPIPKDFLGQYNTFYNKRHFIEDFYLLQSCDYIIGPHSIFTLMANYLGNSKICQVVDASTTHLSLDDFLYCEELLQQKYLHIKSVDER